eukprot:356105-Chlamydomonas_euryale.AAC.2
MCGLCADGLSHMWRGMAWYGMAKGGVPSRAAPSGRLEQMCTLQPNCPTARLRVPFAGSVEPLCLIPSSAQTAAVPQGAAHFLPGTFLGTQ